MKALALPSDTIHVEVGFDDDAEETKLLGYPTGSVMQSLVAKLLGIFNANKTNQLQVLTLGKTPPGESIAELKALGHTHLISLRRTSLRCLVLRLSPPTMRCQMMEL